VATKKDTDEAPTTVSDQPPELVEEQRTAAEERAAAWREYHLRNWQASR
jgi:hypothetical protein